MKLKILAVGAHPDDVEIGCAGLLLKAIKSEHDVYVYILTRGEAGGSDGENREKEAKKSARTIGVKELWFGGFSDTRLAPDGVIINSIESIINKIQPNLVLSHSIKDDHHDHRKVGSSSIEAARYVPNFLTYENPLTKDFIPQVYVDISDQIEEKINLLSLFESQKDKAYLKSLAIQGLAQYRALQSRIPDVKFAEAFQVLKLKLFDIQAPFM